MDKKLSALGGLWSPDPHQGLCPWNLLGAPSPDPILNSHSTCSPWSAPSLPSFSQILDLPLQAGRVVLKYRTHATSVFGYDDDDDVYTAVYIQANLEDDIVKEALKTVS